MTKQRSVHRWSCGHTRTYWTNVPRNKRNRFPCGPCVVRREEALERAVTIWIPAFLDCAHNLFMNIGRCIADKGRLSRERRVNG